MLVPAKPFVDIQAILAYSGFSQNSIWGDKTHYFSSGSQALQTAIDILCIPSDSIVVLPAFICRSVPDLLARRGFKLHYIDSSFDSSMPVAEDLALACYSTKARVLYFVDYFGFLPDRRKWLSEQARDAGCFVIEDRCHSALTQPNDEVADAVVYSIRKIIPCPDGGALRLADSRLPSGPCRSFPISHDVSFFFRRVVEQLICKLGWPNIYSSSIDMLRHNKIMPKQYEAADFGGSSLNNQRSFKPSWLLSRQINNAKYLASISERRIKNYRLLLKKIIELGLTPLFPVLPPDVVPQVFPVKDSSVSLVNFLRAHGIGATHWPDVELPLAVSAFPERYPNACCLNREVACLPVHQSISDHHIDLMMNLISKWKNNI